MKHGVGVFRKAPLPAPDLIEKFGLSECSHSGVVRTNHEIPDYLFFTYIFRFRKECIISHAS